MSIRPSLSKSNRATPPDMDSTMNFFSGADMCLNVIPLSAVMSRNCGFAGAAACAAAGCGDNPENTRKKARKVRMGGKVGSIVTCGEEALPRQKPVDIFAAEAESVYSSATESF